VCVVCGIFWSGFGGVSVLCVGHFGVNVGEKVYVVFGTVWNVFGRVIVCCVWDSLEWVWGSECVLCVRQFDVGLGE